MFVSKIHSRNLDGLSSEALSRRSQLSLQGIQGGCSYCFFTQTVPALNHSVREDGLPGVGSGIGCRQLKECPLSCLCR